MLSTGYSGLLGRGAVRRRTPDLTAVFRPGTPEREALNALIAALHLAERALHPKPKA